MAQGKQAIKRRIKSVEATKKITNAMELISTTKLRKIRNKMDDMSTYATHLSKCIAKIYAASDNSESVYLQKNDAPHPLTIVFSSDLGLCGAYNANTYRMMREVIESGAPIIVVGQRGASYSKFAKFNCIDAYFGFDEVPFEKIKELANKAIRMYVNNEINSIQVLYTKFVNAVSFSPEVKTLMPVDTNAFEKQEEASGMKVETIFEPNAKAVLDEVIPMYLISSLYSLALQSKTSEQASRRLAMENATDNAEELIDKLVLQFNQARQGAITQELSEIVAGADAL